MESRFRLLCHASPCSYKLRGKILGTRNGLVQAPLMHSNGVKGRCTGVSQTCDLEQRVAGVPAIEERERAGGFGGGPYTVNQVLCAQQHVNLSLRLYSEPVR